MENFDINKILNSSPTKKLIIGFNHLKENYTESAALEYKSLYDSKPISFILENSRYIFSEPFFGLKFYEEAVTESIAYPMMENELDKIEMFMSENVNSMNETQKEIYDSFHIRMKNFFQENYNKIMISSYAFEHADQNQKDVIVSLWDSYSSYDSNNAKVTLESAFDAIDNQMSYFAYAPNIIEKQGSVYSVKRNLPKFFSEKVSLNHDPNNRSFANFAESIFTVSKLSKDSNYSDLVDKIPNKSLKMTFTGMMNESVIEQLNSLRTVHVEESVLPVVSSCAVDHLFDDFFSLESEYIESDEECKNYLDSHDESVYEFVNDFLNYEYTHISDTEHSLIGYESVINEQLTFDEAIQAFTEANESSYDSLADGMPKSIATSIQTKAMDSEAKYYKAKAEREKDKTTLRNTVKAVTAIPTDMVKSIKNTMHEWDTADDNRRKEFILKPGFRKKIFRNMKLALLYGGIASCNLLLVPITFIIRHFSKMKDVRIRNEIIREVETEIKICDEKISDANSNNDQDKKYKLMRIKSGLEQELLRVKSNSKYV